MFWSALLVTLLAVCVWLIVDSVREYLKYDVTKLTRVEEDQAPLFPTITICQRFPFNTHTAAQLITRSSSGVEPDSNSEVVRLLEKWSLEQTGSHMNESMKRSLSELKIINCRIGARECNSSDFQWIWMPKYYGCYRFNSGFDANDRAVPMIRAEERGVGSTFALTMYTRLSFKMNSTRDHPNMRGFYVFIQNASHSPLNPTPFPLTLSNSNSHEISISLKRSFYKKFIAWPYNYSDCRVDEQNEPIGALRLADSTLFDQARHTGYRYTRNTCINLCAQLLTRRKCHCDSFDLPPLLKAKNRTTNLCLSVNETECASKFFYSEFMIGDFIKHNCFDKCPLECHSSQLNINSMRTYRNYPNPYDFERVQADPALMARIGIKDKIRSNKYLLFPDLVKNLIKFSIGYESPLSAIGVEEQAKISLDELVGTLGGHLHLLLGMTLLSFLELFELGVIVCAHACRSSDEKEENEDHPPSPSLNDQPTTVSSPAVEIATISSSRIEDGSISEDQVDQEPTIQHPLHLRSTDSAIPFDSTAVAVETATISSSDCQQTREEDQKCTTHPPSEIRPNDDVESEIGTTTATKTDAAFVSASSVELQQQYDQTLLQLLATYVQQIKIDVLSNIFHSHWLAFKAFWLLLLIAFVGVCTALVTVSVIDYFQCEVISTTRIFTEHTAVFPTITVCPFHDFDELLKIDNRHSLTDYARSLAAQANASNILQLEAYAKNTTGAYLTNVDKQRLTSFSALLRQCNIGSTTCNSSDFDWLWHPVLLNCYRFNGKGLITTQVAGEANFAFHLVMHDSFYLYVHNSSEYPFGASSSQQLFVYGNTNVNVQRSFYSQFNAWPYDYSKCGVDENDKLFFGNDPDKLFERSRKYLHDHNYKYSRDTCVAFCLQQETMRKCECNSYNLSMPIDDRAWCLSSEEQVCAKEIVLSEEKNCLSKCPLECNRRKLEMQSSQDFGRKCKLTVQTSYYSCDYWEVNVFYDTMEYMITEERAKMSIWDLFGTVGSHLHLFLGMSPMSFLEIGEILLWQLFGHFVDEAENRHSKHLIVFECVLDL